MRLPIVVIGASGFGRETLDTIAAVNDACTGEGYEVLGVVDDAPSPESRARLERRGVRHLGGLEGWLASSTSLESADLPSYVVGIGDPSVRARIAARLDASGLSAARVVHPSAVVGTSVSIGDGVVICAGAIISTDVVLGRHCHVNPGAVVGHDAFLGDFVSVNPNATISGSCFIADQTLVGAGAVVLQGLSVGSGVTVGAAACVTRSVPNGMIVKGVPGRWNTSGV